MPNAEDLIVNFMNEKTKESLGEKIDKKTADESDNYETSREKAKFYDTKIDNKESEKALLAAKKAMQTVMMIPLFIGGIVSFIYIIQVAFPTIVSIIKTIFKAFF